VKSISLPLGNLLWNCSSVMELYGGNVMNLTTDKKVAVCMNKRRDCMGKGLMSFWSKFSVVYNGWCTYMICFQWSRYQLDFFRCRATKVPCCR